MATGHSPIPVSILLHQTFPDLQDNKISLLNIRLPRPYCKLCKISVFHVVALRRMRQPRSQGGKMRDPGNEVENEIIYTFSFRCFSCNL